MCMTMIWGFFLINCPASLLYSDFDATTTFYNQRFFAKYLRFGWFSDSRFVALSNIKLFPVAVTCGNTFVLKPSKKDPSDYYCTNVKLIELLHQFPASLLLKFVSNYQYV